MRNDLQARARLEAEKPEPSIRSSAFLRIARVEARTNQRDAQQRDVAPPSSFSGQLSERFGPVTAVTTSQESSGMLWNCYPYAHLSRLRWRYMLLRIVVQRLPELPKIIYRSITYDGERTYNFVEYQSLDNLLSQLRSVAPNLNLLLADREQRIGDGPSIVLATTVEIMEDHLNALVLYKKEPIRTPSAIGI